MNKKRFIIMIAHVERETPELYAVKNFIIDNDYIARAIITSDLTETLFFDDESITNALKIVKNDFNNNESDKQIYKIKKIEI